MFHVLKSKKYYCLYWVNMFYVSNFKKSFKIFVVLVIFFGSFQTFNVNASLSNKKNIIDLMVFSVVTGIIGGIFGSIAVLCIAKEIIREEIDEKNFQIKISDSIIKAKNCELESKNCELESKNCELEAKNCELESKNCELKTKNLEIQFKDLQLKEKDIEHDVEIKKLKQEYENNCILNAKSKIQNVKSKIKEKSSNLKEAIRKMSSFKKTSTQN